jgi:hypothetical protein
MIDALRRELWRRRIFVTPKVLASKTDNSHELSKQKCFVKGIGRRQSALREIDLLAVGRSGVGIGVYRMVGEGP